MDGVDSADTAGVIEQPHWTTSNQSRKAEIAYVAIFCPAALSVTTQKGQSLG
jgi:hypothetical protein